MIYAERLPKLEQLRRLALGIESFPITGLGIVQYAEHSGYDEEVINFLRRFSHGMVFKDRDDFVNHCGLLVKLFEEESRSLPEQLKSPQE